MLNPQENKIVSDVANVSDELISLVKKLVSIETVNPPGLNYELFTTILKEWLDSRGIEVSIHVVPQEVVEKRSPDSQGLPRPILLARLGDSNRRELHLNGHYDVVPAGEGWSVCEPFQSSLQGGRLYGRGASDMKGGLASMVMALYVLSKYERELQGSVSFSATPDEEIGGSAGVGYMLEKPLVKPSLCLIGEPSGVSNIWDSHKGLAWLRVSARGKSAHGANPWMGVNAFEYSSILSSYLFKNYVPRVAQRRSSKRSLDEKGNLATVNLGGVVSGGTKINTVPDRVSFTVDRRLIPEEKSEEAVLEFNDAVRRCVEDNNWLPNTIKIETMRTSEPCICSDRTPLDLLSEAIRDVIGGLPDVTLCSGGLDMHYFVEHGIPTMTYGPGSINLAHAADEYVEVSDLVEASKIYALASYRYLTESRR